MEHQRQTFDEERALWNTERTELHEKVAQLERSLRQHKIISSSQVSSPVNNSDGGFQSNSSIWSLPSKGGSHDTSVSTTGDEIWRGPKPDVQPSRTFSDPTTQSTRPGDRSRLPSIAEDTTCGGKESSVMQPGPRKLSVSAAVMDKNLDGINFKSGILSSGPVKKVMTPQSPSPRTSSPSHVAPGILQLPSSKIVAPFDLYTKDAGHTPLVRRTYFNTDGASSESNEVSPMQPETERPPLEPQVSFRKLPSERSDSYFPVAEDESCDEKDGPGDQKDKSQDWEDESRDEDPELKGPLGINDSEGGDKQFLLELDSKLVQAARSKANSPPSVASDKGGSLDTDEKDFEQPEHEPELRIKRSMNFGSAFGSKTCGKGI